MAFVSALVAILGMSGCSTAQIDSIPKEIGGLPEGAPKRADVSPDYPAVHDMPPPRTTTLLDVEQQKRMEADLIATRNRQPGQEKNRIKEAQKKARLEAKEKKPKGSGKGKNKDRPQAGAGQTGVSAGRFNQAGANQGAPAAADAPAWPAPAAPQPAGFGRNP
jgi:hypothetical protein